MPRRGICPPVMAYSEAEQARVAKEVAVLPEGAKIMEGILCCGDGRGRMPSFDVRSRRDRVATTSDLRNQT